MKKILVIASTMLFGLIGANAAMTAPNTDINNTATLSYEVSGVAQTTVDASDPGFVVDRKIDVQVANTDTDKSVDVTPSAVDQELHFTIANLGNDQETYTLSYADLSAPDDQYDPTNCQINAGAGFVDFTTTITIAAETNASVIVQCDIPAQGTVHDDDNGTIVLTAAVNGRTKANDDADVADQVQDIFADGSSSETGDAANDGKHADRGTYHVVSADLSLVKTSIVTEDPVTGTTTPHRIPGATVRYCFVVDNNGSADASNVNITDDFTADNKDKLTVVNAGHVVQANTTACDCAGIADTSGSTGTTSAITTGADTVNANQRMCAYIEATVN